MHALYTNKKIAHAAHNIMAYRLAEHNGGGDGVDARTLQINECDDDGETAAGSRLLHLLDLMGANNVLVVVTRWYGGIHLGPDRFKVSKFLFVSLDPDTYIHLSTCIFHSQAY
jgi:putative IMPACT (imprinted ancient) family translation regulator